MGRQMMSGPLDRVPCVRCRCSERLLLGDAFISTAGASDLELANLIAREMVYKCGFSRRLGPVALMDSQTGFLRGHGSETMADIGTELAAIALTDIKDVRRSGQSPQHPPDLQASMAQACACMCATSEPQPRSRSHA